MQGDGLTDEILEAGWYWHGDRIASDYKGPAGTRPWAWWWFEAKEEKPDGRDAEALRLAELGELQPDELATLRDRAEEARSRIGTDREIVSGGSLERSPGAYSLDRRAVELLERIEGALAR